MEKFTKNRLESLREAVRKNWPNITDQEVELTNGDKDQLRNLILSKGSTNKIQVDEKLESIYLRIQEGHPETVDSHFGIEKAKKSPPPPHSNEWRAREESN